jgi:hypothetical protein
VPDRLKELPKTAPEGKSLLEVVRFNAKGRVR